MSNNSGCEKTSEDLGDIFVLRRMIGFGIEIYTKPSFRIHGL